MWAVRIPVHPVEKKPKKNRPEPSWLQNTFFKNASQLLAHLRHIIFQEWCILPKLQHDCWLMGGNQRFVVNELMWSHNPLYLAAWEYRKRLKISNLCLPSIVYEMIFKRARCSHDDPLNWGQNRRRVNKIRVKIRWVKVIRIANLGLPGQ